MSKQGGPLHGITEQLQKWNQEPNPEADDELMNLVYQELHRQARRLLRKERQGHTLQTTALVHEAYLKLIEQKSVRWESRSHFFAIAATMMRRILIDYAKNKNRIRRGGGQQDLLLEEALTIAVSDLNFDLLALDEALDRLAEKEEQLVKVVELRYFAGLNIPETAAVLGISESTVGRDWLAAKAWLRRELTKSGSKYGSKSGST